MKIFLVLCVLFVSIGAMVSFGAEDATMSLQGYLIRMGQKFDCYFTAEGVSVECDNNPILHARIKISNEPKDLDDLINTITNAISSARLPGNITPSIELDIIKTDRTPTIIHILDKRLQQISKYALNSNMSLEYKGSPEGLVEHLSGIVPSIQKKNGFGVGSGPIVSDYGTKITVTANQKKVRDILTDYIPLTNYNHIIWSSGTDLTGENPSTKVWFHGPDARKEKGK